MASDALRRRVWDLPTRVVHWLLVLLLGFSWWSAQTFHMDWHRWAGLAVLGLVLFRVLWGFVGTETSRFAQFLKGPRGVWSYLRPAPGVPAAETIGHNPLGGWSVLAMLLLLATQVVSGLFAVDIDGIESGPLSYLVDFDNARFASAAHETSFNLLLILVPLHIAAVLFYLVVKRRNLVGPMITGSETIATDCPSARRVPLWRFVAAALTSVAVVSAVALELRF